MRLLVVPEPRAERAAERLVQRLLAGVPERRVPRVVTEPDRLGQVVDGRNAIANGGLIARKVGENLFDLCSRARGAADWLQVLDSSSATMARPASPPIAAGPLHRVRSRRTQ